MVFNLRNLRDLFKVFKTENPAWKDVKCIITDKNITERSVLKEEFPQANTIICVFHTLKTSRREITAEKMGISQQQRQLCLELLQKLVYARNNENFNEIYEQFLQSAPQSVIKYVL